MTRQRKPCALARELRSPKYRQRVVDSDKRYNRKVRHAKSRPERDFSFPAA